ncbi:MAG: CDP-glycerol glycerophosphotransferase family protein [Lachnospiraceae bacterium]
MNIFKKIYYIARNFFPISNSIVFESVPDFSDNTKAVYDEMVSRGLNRKYKFVWLCWKDDVKKCGDSHDILIMSQDYIKKWYYTTCSKCLISCNRYLGTLRKGQISFYLSHGTPIKRVGHSYKTSNEVDYLLTASKEVNKMCAYEFGFDETRTIPLGFPRNDVLTLKHERLTEYFGNEGSKIVVWYPTFRQHRNGKNTASQYALPILHDQDMAIELNHFVKEKNVVLVIKPHFAQDVSYIKKMELSNIIFIDDSFFEKIGKSSYDFLASSDALITDYSSVYYDYTLCDKPIAVVWEDIEQYRREPGFAVDLDDYLKGAVKIYSLNDFKAFILDLAEGNDRLRIERNEIKNRVNYSTDARNAERVVDFIIEKSNL